jgi:hypothetical protein
VSVVVAGRDVAVVVVVVVVAAPASYYLLATKIAGCG